MTVSLLCSSVVAPVAAALKRSVHARREVRQVVGCLKNAAAAVPSIILNPLLPEIIPAGFLGNTLAPALIGKPIGNSIYYRRPVVSN